MTKSDSADKLEFEVLCFSKFLKYKGRVLHIMNLVVVPQVVYKLEFDAKSRRRT